MNSTLMIMLASFLFILVSLIMNYKHLLMTLLCLEGMMLCTLMFMPTTLNLMNSPIHQSSLIMLSISACEASLGLSLIVKLTRCHGSDLMSSNSINMC